MSEYVTVAETNQVPLDRGLPVRVNDRDFAVFKVGEAFFAIDGICPHKGAPLGQGFTDQERVYCPLHGWEFNVQTGACLDFPDKSLCAYPTRVENGKVQILI